MARRMAVVADFQRRLYNVSNLKEGSRSMRQLVVILLAIGGIPILLKKKVPVGPALVLLGILAGLLGGLTPQTVLSAFTRVFTEWDTLSAVLVVIEIGMVSILMNHYGILKRAEDALRKLVPSSKAVIMLLPCMVGALQAPGGAALSAPFVNTMGEEMGLSRAARSNINVVCRHILPILAPFSPNIIIVHTLVPEVSLLQLALLNLGFVVLMQLAGYFFLLRKGKPLALPKVGAKERLLALWDLVITLSPIYLIIILDALFQMPYPLSLLLSLLLVFLLSDKKDFPRQLGRSFNADVAMMIIGVYFFQNIVSGAGDLIALFQSLIAGNAQWVFLGMIALVGTLFGIATGLMYLPLGVLVPIAMNLPYPSETARMIALFYTFCWCFIGYVFSPIHLCQLLSDQVTGCTVGERYKAYLPMMVALPIFVVGLYFLYTLILV